MTPRPFLTEGSNGAAPLARRQPETLDPCRCPGQFALLRCVLREHVGHTSALPARNIDEGLIVGILDDPRKCLDTGLMRRAAVAFCVFHDFLRKNSLLGTTAEIDPLSSPSFL